MRRRLLCSSLLILIVVPTSARAQQFEVTPLIGFAAIDLAEDDDHSPSSLALHAGIDDQPVAGLILGLGINRRSQIELLYSRLDTQVENFLFDQSSRDLDLEYLHVGYLHQWPLGLVEPFVVGSVGTTRMTVDGRGDDAFSLSGGGGLKVLFNDRFGFRFASRLFLTVIDEDGPLLCPLNSCPGHGGEEGLVQLDFRAGLFVRF